MGGKYIIKNATVVSVDEKIGNVSNCDVLIENSFIAAVGQNLQHSDHKVIDGTNAIVSPGFIDTHRHTWQTQTRTIASDYILSHYILNLRHIYGSSYTPHDAYIGNYCGALDSIDNGITYLVDHSHIINSPEHADAAINGLRNAKIRAVFCPAQWPNPYWEGSCLDKEREEKTPDWRLDEEVRRIRETHFESNEPTDLVRFGFALSEPDLTPIDRLVREIKVARSLGAAVITGHISFGKWDPGNFVTRQLAGRDMLAPDLLWSHGNTLSDEELDYCKKYHIGISTTPDTELQMGMSHPVAFKAADRGCIASLGVDVCCSAPADIFQQMRLLLQAQRHLEHEKGEGAPLQMSRKCSEVLEMATLGGAKAVGLEKIIGSITPGKRADLLITRCDAPRLTPVHDPVGALVLYANGSDIDTVFIDGVTVKSEGKLAHINWPEVREELRASTASVMERSKKAPMEDLEVAQMAMVGALDNINRQGKEKAR